MRNAISVSAAVSSLLATLLGGAAFAEQILVGPTVERAKEMDGQLEFLRHCEVDRNPETADVVGETYLRGEFVPQDLKKAREFYRLAVTKDGRWKGFDLTEDWVANVRTNRTISTHVRFRDEEWVPFLQRELTTDVSPDDLSREKVLALVANAAKWLWRYVHTPDSKQVSAAGMDDFLRE